MNDDVLCPVNPIGHEWDGLGCRWCPATRTPGEAIVSGLASRRGGDRDSARTLLDAYRAELLAEAKTEVVAWLVKKDRENTPVGELASKVDRGAIRIFLGTGHYRDAMDAHRTEAFAEGARLLEDAACDADWTRTPDFCAGLRAGAELLLANTEKATAAAATATPDTLAAWLRQRFTASSVSWDNLDDTERDYWEHQALAVRRAVERGGFRTADPEAGEGK